MTMDERTLTALKASIEKWERNARVERREDVLTGVQDCPLCKLFFSGSCQGCPIAEAVNNIWCDDTPYEEASNVLSDWYDGEATASDFHAAAQAEVDFLKSLLPEDERASAAQGL